MSPDVLWWQDGKVFYGLHFSLSDKIESELFRYGEHEKVSGDCTMKAKELDKLFDSGKDITSHLDLKTKKRPGYHQRRVNVDFPDWMIKTLDREAVRIGVTRQSIIKMWIADRIKEETEEYG